MLSTRIIAQQFIFSDSRAYPNSVCFPVYTHVRRTMSAFIVPAGVRTSPRAEKTQGNFWVKNTRHGHPHLLFFFLPKIYIFFFAQSESPPRHDFNDNESVRVTQITVRLARENKFSRIRICLSRRLERNETAPRLSAFYQFQSPSLSEPISQKLRLTVRHPIRLSFRIACQHTRAVPNINRDFSIN